MVFNFNLKAPKNVFLKLGKIFDLATINIDAYQLVLLSSTSGLVLDNLDKFDSSLSAYESDPTKYTKSVVPLQLNETSTGYQINIVGNSITVDLTNATIQGLLLIKSDTKDILAADLYVETLQITRPLNLVAQKPVLDYKREDSS